MEDYLKYSIETLLLEAKQAADAGKNGLMDRGDLQDMIARLDAILQKTLATCCGLEKERQTLIAHLSRLRSGGGDVRALILAEAEVEADAEAHSRHKSPTGRFQ